MNRGKLAFTVVYHRAKYGYVVFIEELPGALVFDEERRSTGEMLAGKDVVRQSFFIPMPECR